MAICGCGPPAHCCQPAVAGGIIYADLWDELNNPLALQALFTIVLLCMSLCYKLSPFKAHWGRWNCTRFLWPACLFTAHVGSGSCPSPVEFCSFCHSHKLSHSWFLGTCPFSHWSISGQAQLAYLQFPEGFPSPPLWHSVHSTLFATCLNCSYCLLLSFSFFPRWGLVCPGGYAVLAQCCLWEYCILLSSPCLRLPKPSGRGQLVARGPSWFLRLTWSGDSLC
jgi:hypothetical protein